MQSKRIFADVTATAAARLREEDRCWPIVNVLGDAANASATPHYGESFWIMFHLLVQGCQRAHVQARGAWPSTAKASPLLW
eukprot:4980134-Pyramimonas_sp.AAC.1